MKRIKKTSTRVLTLLLLVVLSMSTVVLADDDEEEPTELKTVALVNLEKYIGVWYEYARIPNSFQDDCALNTTATYTLREDGKIDVINRCIDAEGDTIEANGIARVVDLESKSKLEVSFVRLLGINLFWGDYWIIGLADDYRYAVVGDPSRKYGWILTRRPNLSEEDFSTIKNILKSQRYDPENFNISHNEY